MTLQLKQEEPQQIQIGGGSYFDNGQMKVIKNTLCPGITDEELELFAYVCRQCKLDPFLKQIYAIRRKEKQKDGSYKEKMTIQTAIDGLRLIADRTGKYIPGRESTYEYDGQGKLYKATSYIKKQAADGSWHEVSASALYHEFKPNYSNNFWDKFSHIMLAKAAEAQALRKAFPAEMCGLLSDEEMYQADAKPIYTEPAPALASAPNFSQIPYDKKPKVCITPEQSDELMKIYLETEEAHANSAFAKLKEFGYTHWSEVSPEFYARIKTYMLRKPKETPRSMDEVAQEMQQEKSVFEEV